LRKTLRQILSINEAAILVDRTSILAEKEMRRDTMREMCSNLELSFNLRHNKIQLARKIFTHYLRKDELDLFKWVAEKAHIHWTYKIDSGDKHSPLMYQRLLKTSELVLETLERIERSR
jgi:hypothetical protein